MRKREGIGKREGMREGERDEERREGRIERTFIVSGLKKIN